MEELQEALKGKPIDCSGISELHESVICLPKDCSKPKQRKCKCVQHSQTKSSKTSATDISPQVYDFVKEEIVVSEPTDSKRVMELGLTSHLAFRRHSLGSVTEFKSEAKAPTYDRMMNYYSSPNLNEDEIFLPTDYNMHSTNYFILSPIQEHSEISTKTSSSVESEDFSEKICRQYPVSSCSCDVLSARCLANVKLAAQKYKTFPRSKADLLLNSSDSASYNLDDMDRFPLAPREIDPFSYYQLHTADSQEDLHEFLLLETACMSENKGSGLAAAFCTTKDNSN